MGSITRCAQCSNVFIYFYLFILMIFQVLQITSLLKYYEAKITRFRLIGGHLEFFCMRCWLAEVHLTWLVQQIIQTKTQKTIYFKVCINVYQSNNEMRKITGLYHTLIISFIYHDIYLNSIISQFPKRFRNCRVDRFI